MRGRRAVRVTLTLLAIAAIGTAGYFYWTAHRRLTGIITSHARLDESRAAATRAAFDLRSAQQAYVAAAQNETFWFDKATSSVDALRSMLPALEAATTSVEARTALADAAASLEELEQRDRRIRGYVSSGQRLLASDIIFSDGVELVARINAGLDRAAAAASRETDAARRKAMQDQAVAAGAASAAAILALLLLTPVASSANTIESSAESKPSHKSMVELDLRPTPNAREPRASAKQIPMKTVPAAAPDVSAPSKPPIELQALARVCTDLARLSDSTSISALLEQTAAALDASGIVLWVADGERRELTPVAAHGYAPSVLVRMGALRADAENATAAAFRTGLLQTVAAGPQSSGAVAAPLVSPTGCVGVMTAEMRNNGEKNGARHAAASIVAAQLATIVGPASQPEDTAAALR
jgi:hypothetical protein